LNCHPEQSEGPAFALAFLAVIPEGNLLFRAVNNTTTFAKRIENTDEHSA
jgi:hypothetical protein